MVSFPYFDPYEWVQFREAFYGYTGVVGEAFEFRKEAVRLQKRDTTLLQLLGIFCRRHNLPSCGDRYARSCNYIGQQTDVLQARLARSKEWCERKKGGSEWKEAFARELKASKTAVARFWNRYHKQAPPRLRKQDKVCVVESLSIRDRALVPIIPQLVSALTSSKPK